MAPPHPSSAKYAHVIHPTRTAGDLQAMGAEVVELKGERGKRLAASGKWGGAAGT